MKKTIFTMIMATVAMNINAQLVVDSLGRVGIGTETPQSMLSVGHVGDSLAAVFCQPSNKLYGIYAKNFYDSISTTYGIYSRTRNVGRSCYGNRAIAEGNHNGYNNTNSSQLVIGVGGSAGKAYTAIGVFGGLVTSNIPCKNFAGVYGTSTNSTPDFSNYSGTYAGYFNGRVRVTNGIYATVLSPSASASPSGVSGTTILSNRDGSVTDKLSQVQAVKFLRYDPTKETKTEKISPTDIDIENKSPEDLNALAANTDEEPEQYLSPIQYGLAADQLKAVYPELVYEDANGNISINYVEMVPLLVKSINELSQELAELKGTASKRAKPETTGIEKNVSDIDMVRMDQNKPNPFSESTVIGLNIPEKTQKANIFIYDLSGKQIQNVPVAERGETNITVYASDLGAGMYIYTLVVDGKVVVTRRMIVEK